VDLDGLLALVARSRRDILPFVGSGLTLAAGAPGDATLARDLARRTGVDEGTLTVVTRDAEDRHGAAAVQAHVAEIFSGLRLRPTPALTAVCGAPGRRVLTTNYDDGLEQAARARDLEPITLRPNDARIVDDGPGEGQLYVIHLHGIPDEPSSIVLPGATTHGLADDEIFTRFVSAVMAPRILVYLGFSLGAGESHLREIVRWLGAQPENTQRQYLLQDRAGLADRRGELENLSTYRNVTVVEYYADPRHTAVERVAVALAPREDDELAWVWPPLLRVRAGEDDDRLRSRITGFDYEYGEPTDVQFADDVLAESRSLVVGGPGLGKTTLLDNLPHFDPKRPHARAQLRDFRSAEPPERGILKLLRGIRVEELDAGDALLALDGLDEVDEGLENNAVAAVLAAIDQWPSHTWVVTSRPGRAAAALAATGMPEFRLFASRRWARAYLETRAVPPDRVARALLDGYGLGDLLAIPALAKRLADHLLQDGSDVTPLKLLVDQQHQAARDEADRHRQATASLADWLRSVAIALELRGRTSAPIQELVDLRGPGELSAAEARRRLVEVTLLADMPGTTAFPAKTLQEGLVADAILQTRDVVETVRQIAMAEIAGRPRLRDDLELTLDLVFEHADRDTRRGLRELDPLRWARTVPTRGDEHDAREAFELIWAWHAERALAFALAGEEGLRTTRQAITEIVRRWPQVALERRETLERDLCDERPAARLRALTVLSALPTADDRTAGWLVPLLSDGAARVVELAAGTAARLRVREAEDALTALLKARNDLVRIAALRALVELVDADRLPQLAARVKVADDLRRVSRRLNERLDLDTAIALVRTRDDMNATTAWLVDRLVDTAHPGAWTATRVAALAQACAARHGSGMPDPQRLATVFARHPQEAIAAVQVARVGGKPYAPRQQLLALARLDASLLAGDGHADLRAAVAGAVAEEEERARREADSDRAMRLRELLDARGVDVDARELLDLLPPRRDIDARHRDMLLEIVDRWWPEAGFPEDIDERHHALLELGASIEAPLTVERWMQLLDEHAAAPRFGRYPLGCDTVTWWLHQTYGPQYDNALIQRIDGADGDELRTLAVIGHAGPPGAVTDAVIARLRASGPATPAWRSVVGLMADRADAAGTVHELLTPDVPPDVRAYIIAGLARTGDAAAQAEHVGDVARRVEAGERPERLAHWKPAETPELLAALGRLADAALTHGANELRGSALGHLGQWTDPAVLDVLDDLVRRHDDDDAWIAITRDNAARRFATRAVLDRLAPRLADVAAFFDTLV